MTLRTKRLCTMEQVRASVEGCEPAAGEAVALAPVQPAGVANLPLGAHEVGENARQRSGHFMQCPGQQVFLFGNARIQEARNEAVSFRPAGVRDRLSAR